MKTAIIKYNAGNVTSVINALERLGVTPILTDEVEEIRSADKIIFPGQGEASTCMTYLKAKGLDQVIRDLKQPFLGVCLGLQLLCKHSEEGDTDCLGVFDVNVRKFPPLDKVPHVGWNKLTDLKSPLFKGLNEPFFYYVHSYYAELGEQTIAQTDYIKTFSAALHKDNFYAVQAHPEKSGKEGELILKNFLEL
ncbi:imidazole glycerol phosphate synthase subunit HisH [Fulvitalea axinellae]|uniref:Imidazole glycerol phosphate synthase subunit HisH n=1 Tax=Fulvitalea axinellae TaxID=1182444 RepID=A0AAU9CP60_9BACT|nr:imidazole glycerol phosphate synthase subunit HisH [Fulvitalea axinellae]